MEVKRINDAGGINGRPIEVIIEDDATDEAKAVAAASKLIEQDKVVAIIGATGTGQTMAMRGDDRPRGHPAGLDGRRHRHHRRSSTRWSSRRRGPTRIVVPFTLDYLKKQGITKIGLISDSGGFGKDGQAVLKAEAPKSGIDDRRRPDLQPRRHGHDRAAHQDQELRRSGVVMWTAGKEAATVVKNAKELGLTMPDLRQPRQRAHGVHRGRRRRSRGLHVRRRQDPPARDVRRGHRGLQGRHRLHRPLHGGVRRAAEHLRRVTPTTRSYLIVEAAKRVRGRPRRRERCATRSRRRKGFVGIGGTFTFSPTDHNGLTQGRPHHVRDQTGPASWVHRPGRKRVRHTATMDGARCTVSRTA